MKILAPFDSLNEVDALIRAGADELYCGVNDNWWKKRNLFANARKMSWGNLRDSEELNLSISAAHRRDIPVFLCVNEYLSQGAREKALEEIKESVQMGIDGFILADPSLVPEIKKHGRGRKLILSSLSACLNKYALRFYKDKGMQRITLPLNQLSLAETEEMMKTANALSLETEVFVNNVVCKNMPGTCLFNKEAFRSSGSSAFPRALKKYANKTIATLPGPIKRKINAAVFSSRITPKPCRQSCKLDIFSSLSGKRKKVGTIDRYSPEKTFAYRYCSRCIIYFLHKFKATSGKIIGRGYPFRKKLKDILFTKRFIEELKSGEINDDNFLEKGCRLYSRIYRKKPEKDECFFRVNAEAKVNGGSGKFEKQN